MDGVQPPPSIASACRHGGSRARACALRPVDGLRMGRDLRGSAARAGRGGQHRDLHRRCRMGPAPGRRRARPDPCVVTTVCCPSSVRIRESIIPRVVSGIRPYLNRKVIKISAARSCPPRLKCCSICDCPDMSIDDFSSEEGWHSRSKSLTVNQHVQDLHDWPPTHAT